MQERESLSEDAQDFVARLLVVEPSERLSAYDALQHPWITRQRASTQAADQNMGLVASVLRQLKRFQRCEPRGGVWPRAPGMQWASSRPLLTHPFPTGPAPRRYPLFKRRVLTAIAHTLPREALDPVRRAFNAIDADMDGYINVAELRLACEAHLRTREVEDIFEAIDVDGKCVTAAEGGKVLGSPDETRGPCCAAAAAWSTASSSRPR